MKDPKETCEKLTSELFHSCEEKDLKDRPLVDPNAPMGIYCCQYETDDMMIVRISRCYACMPYQ